MAIHSSILAWRIPRTEDRGKMINLVKKKIIKHNKEANYKTYWMVISIRCKKINTQKSQFSSVAQSCPTLCDPMDCSMTGFPIHHQLLELAQTHVHQVDDAIQPSHPLLSPSPPAFNLSQHQGLFKWVSSSHQVAKILEFQLQSQSFQWRSRTDFI